MKALYKMPALFGVFEFDPREVELLEWIEEYGRPKMARILVPTHPRSILGILARRDRLPLPAAVVRIVEAKYVSLLQ